METRYCKYCKQVKSVDEFYLRRKGDKTYRQNDCKDCHRIRVREWSHKNPEKAREREFIRRYGITIDDYNHLLIAQKGMCAICGKLYRPKTVTSAKKCVLHVDHDHDKDKVRGLLCNNCNYLLGHAHEEIHILESAIAYLKSHS